MSYATPIAIPAGITYLNSKYLLLKCFNITIFTSIVWQSSQHRPIDILSPVTINIAVHIPCSHPVPYYNVQLFYALHCVELSTEICTFKTAV